MVIKSHKGLRNFLCGVAAVVLLGGCTGGLVPVQPRVTDTIVPTATATYTPTRVPPTATVEPTATPTSVPPTATATPTSRVEQIIVDGYRGKDTLYEILCKCDGGCSSRKVLKLDGRYCLDETGLSFLREKSGVDLSGITSKSVLGVWNPKNYVGPGYTAMDVWDYDGNIYTIIFNGSGYVGVAEKSVPSLEEMFYEKFDPSCFKSAEALGIKIERTIVYLASGSGSVGAFNPCFKVRLGDFNQDPYKVTVNPNEIIGPVKDGEVNGIGRFTVENYGNCDGWRECLNEKADFCSLSGYYRVGANDSKNFLEEMKNHFMLLGVEFRSKNPETDFKGGEYYLGLLNPGKSNKQLYTQKDTYWRFLIGCKPTENPNYRECFFYARNNERTQEVAQ